MMREYDRGFVSATERLLAALRQAGHTVECPVTGSVIVDGVEVTPAEWDRLPAGYDGENLATVLEQIQGYDLEEDDET